jgi:hypothetical protein
MELFLVSLINNKIDVDILLESYNKIYHSNNVREIYINHKYKIINKIIYIINRLEDIDEKKTQITKIYKLYEQYKIDDCIDDDILSWPLFISLEYLLYGLLSNVETNKDIEYKYIEKSINVILKVKKFYDAEYIVEGVENSTHRVIEDGREVEEEMLGNIFITHKGNQVRVGSGFSIEQRRQFYKNPSQIIGKTITVQYFEETHNQHGGTSLRFPTIKAIYETERDF